VNSTQSTIAVCGPGAARGYPYETVEIVNGSGTGTDSFNGGEELAEKDLAFNAPLGKGMMVLFDAISAKPRRTSKLGVLIVTILTRFPPYCMYEDSAPYRENLLHKTSSSTI